MTTTTTMKWYDDDYSRCMMMVHEDDAEKCEGMIVIMVSWSCVGKSLLWVGVLGIIIFYLYALISFAMLRSSFNPENHLYCATLWQCTITVIHYGLIAEIFDVSTRTS